MAKKNLNVKVLKNNEAIDVQLTPEQLKEIEKIMSSIASHEASIVPASNEEAIDNLSKQNPESADYATKHEFLHVPSISELPLRDNVKADAADVYMHYADSLDHMSETNKVFEAVNTSYDNEFGQVESDNHFAPPSMVTVNEDTKTLFFNPSETFMASVYPAMKSAKGMVDAAKYVDPDNTDSKLPIVNIHARNFEISANDIIGSMLNDISKVYAKMIVKYTYDEEKIKHDIEEANRFLGRNLTEEEVINRCKFYISPTLMPCIPEITSLKSYLPIQYENEEGFHWYVSGDTIKFYSETIYNYVSSYFFRHFRDIASDMNGGEDAFVRMMTDYEVNYEYEIKSFITATLLELARIAFVYNTNLRSVEVCPVHEKEFGCKLIKPPFGFVDC